MDANQSPQSGGWTRSFEVWTSVGVGFLALAGCVVLGTQLRVARIERPLLDAQLNYAAQRLTATKAAKTQVDEAILAREGQVKRAAELEAKYSALLSELLELAKVDPDAKAVVVKWKIQQQGQSETAVAKPESRQPAAPQDSRAVKETSAPVAKPKIP
jgi:hypothetical protein